MWHLHLGAVSEDDRTHVACKPVPFLLKVKVQACTLHAAAYRKAGGHLRPGICREKGFCWAEILLILFLRL